MSCYEMRNNGDLPYRISSKGVDKCEFSVM